MNPIENIGLLYANPYSWIFVVMFLCGAVLFRFAEDDSLQQGFGFILILLSTFPMMVLWLLWLAIAPAIEWFFE